MAWVFERYAPTDSPLYRLQWERGESDAGYGRIGGQWRRGSGEELRSPTIHKGNGGVVMMTIKVLVVATSVLVTYSAHALKGNDLLTSCQEGLKFADGHLRNTDIVQAEKCFAYLEGFMSGVNLATAVISGNYNDYAKNMAYCVPDGATTAQGVRIIVKYLRENPAELHLNAEVLLMKALRQSFPCERGAR